MSNAPYVTFNDPWSVFVKSERMVNLRKQGRTIKYWWTQPCSGALITDKAVLTAGHCVCGHQKDPTQVIESKIYLLEIVAILLLNDNKKCNPSK